MSHQAAWCLHPFHAELKHYLNPHFPHLFQQHGLTAAAETGCSGTDGCGCLLLLGHSVAGSSPRGRQCRKPTQQVGPGALAGGPVSPRGSQPLPHLLPPVPAAAAGLPVWLGASGQEGLGLFPLGVKRIWSWMWCVRCGGPSVAQAVSPAPSKGLGREPLLVGAFSARPVGKAWAILRHPCEWCVKL